MKDNTQYGIVLAIQRFLADELHGEGTVEIKDADVPAPFIALTLGDGSEYRIKVMEVPKP
jgi:hypothetical protein